MNIKVKLQNPAFWISLVIGVCTIIGGYFGLTAPDITTWALVWTTLVAAVNNPYVVVLIVVYIAGLFVDFGSLGFKDDPAVIAKTNINQTAQDVINLQLKQASEKSEEATAGKYVVKKTNETAGE